MLQDRSGGVGPAPGPTSVRREEARERVKERSRHCNSKRTASGLFAGAGDGRTHESDVMGISETRQEDPRRWLGPGARPSRAG